MSQNLDVWLWLLLVMKPYNRKTNFILHNCGYDAVTAARQIRDGNLKFLDDSEKRRAAEVRNGAVNELKQLCADNNITIVPFDDDDYPELLRHIENPPIVLFVSGDLKGINERLCISAVGTRNVSEYGIRCADFVCAPLAKVGTIIVSGLAVGGDTAAHEACLNAGGKTVGVLACGNLVNYPAASAQLKRDIIAGGGALISELLPNTKLPQGYFHSRNRIISGLSHGTLVLEAPEGSGSLITANRALEQGREVFCIPPGDISDKRYSGVVPFIRDGATPVFGYGDIIDAFPLLERSTKLPPEFNGAYIKNAKAPGAPKKSKSERENAESDIDEIENAEQSKGAAVNEQAEAKPELNAERLTEMSECEAEIIKLLFKRPADEDYIIDKTGRDFSEVSETLMALEIAGLITRNMDGMYKPLLENC